MYGQTIIVKNDIPYAVQNRTGKRHQEIQEINKPKSVTRAIEDKGRIAINVPPSFGFFWHKPFSNVRRYCVFTRPFKDGLFS